MSQIIVTLTPSPIRRVLATGVLVATAALMLWVLVASPPGDLGWAVFLAVFAALLLWLAVKLWQATERALELREEGLFDSDGRCLASMENIVSVDRGVFAFKPSGGFIVSLKQARGRGWAPGLWWQFGRRVGVGGVTPASQGKVMAEVLQIRLAQKLQS